jgi:hypothetical protein
MRRKVTAGREGNATGTAAHDYLVGFTVFQKPSSPDHQRPLQAPAKAAAESAEESDDAPTWRASRASHPN